MTLYQYHISYINPEGVQSERTLTVPRLLNDVSYNKGSLCRYHMYLKAIFKQKK